MTFEFATQTKAWSCKTDQDSAITPFLQRRSPTDDVCATQSRFGGAFVACAPDSGISMVIPGGTVDEITVWATPLKRT